MYQVVKAYIEKHHMISAGDRVIAGISGGPDSICLLCMLIRLREEIPFDIVAVHVHHGLRGADADADEQFVREFCCEREVPLRVFREDVKFYAKEHRLTEEEAGREVRRDAFEQVLHEEKGTKIALAHHRNDNAETLLWNLFRGTGLKGLGGIAPVLGNCIRPLLSLTRAEIVSYLEKWGISYCTDETNLQNTYTRNRIRNELIPYIEEHVNSRASEHLAETAEQMRMLGEYIWQQVCTMKDMCTDSVPSGIILKKEAYESLPEVMKSYVMHEVLCEAAGKRKDIASVHIRQAEELLNRQVGRRISLPYGVCGVRCYEGVRFEKSSGDRLAEQPEGLPEAEEVFQMRVMDRAEAEEVFSRNYYTKWFDYDIIKNTVKIRTREPGDYITIDRQGRTQKLKQYFINEKIPAELRDKIWLAADGHHIMWIVGRRQNQAYQVTENTKKILEIRYYGGEESGRDSERDDQRGSSCTED